MSDRPMTVPKGAEQFRLAELVMSLPRSWPIGGKGWDHERHWWPFQWLKQLARLPHEFGTWLFCGHTVPNGDPPAPFTRETKLCCMLLSSPALCDEEGTCLAIDKKTQIHFHSVIPIYREEMEFTLTRSSVALLERFEEAGVNELLDPKRPNLCSRSQPAPAKPRRSKSKRLGAR